MLNRVEVSGQLVERKALRHTPAGVPVSEGRIAHHSRLQEAGLPREVECEVPVMALGETARWLEATPLGSLVGLTGFLAARGKSSKSLVLHVTQIEFLEGKENGKVLQEEG
ncbi:MAG: primosomal replication protein [Pseudomonadota bacterium]